MEFRQDDFYDFPGSKSSLPVKPRRKWLVRIGKTIRFIFIACVAVVLTYNAPSIGDRPLGAITLNELLGSLFCFGLALGCIKWMFNSIEDETAENWATAAGSVFGIAVIALVVLFHWH